MKWYQTCLIFAVSREMNGCVGGSRRKWRFTLYLHLLYVQIFCLFINLSRQQYLVYIIFAYPNIPVLFCIVIERYCLSSFRFLPVLWSDPPVIDCLYLVISLRSLVLCASGWYCLITYTYIYHCILNICLQICCICCLYVKKCY